MKKAYKQGGQEVLKTILNIPSADKLTMADFLSSILFVNLEHKWGLKRKEKK